MMAFRPYKKPRKTLYSDIWYDGSTKYFIVFGVFMIEQPSVSDVLLQKVVSTQLGFLLYLHSYSFQHDGVRHSILGITQ